MKEIEKMAKDVFKTPPIPFKFDFEDYQNCKLNGQIKKIISNMNITIPIIHIQPTSSYVIGIKHVKLEIRGTFIEVKEEDNKSC